MAALAAQQAHGHTFPILLSPSTASKVPDLPMPLPSAEVVASGLGAKVVARVHAPQSAPAASYRLDVHARRAWDCGWRLVLSAIPGMALFWAHMEEKLIPRYLRTRTESDWPDSCRNEARFNIRFGECACPLVNANTPPGACKISSARRKAIIPGYSRARSPCIRPLPGKRCRRRLFFSSCLRYMFSQDPMYLEIISEFKS